MIEDVLERPAAPFLNVLVVVFGVVALLAKGFIGRRLGKLSASVDFAAAAADLVVVVVVVEEEGAGLRSDFERCNVDILISLRNLSRDGMGMGCFSECLL